MRSRDRSSSQMETPASARAQAVRHESPVGHVLCGRVRLAAASCRGGGDGFGRDAVLLVDAWRSRPRRRSARSRRSGRGRRRTRASPARCRPRRRREPSRPAGSPCRGRPGPGRRTTRRHGIETTRASMPSAASWSRACDGELDLGAGADEDDVGRAVGVEQDVAAAARRRPASAKPSAPRGKVGTFWRVRHRPAGRSVCSSMVCQAATVSLASAGRTTSRPGIARRAARCSIGWWVGPSSPRPMESWVQT